MEWQEYDERRCSNWSGQRSGETLTSPSTTTIVVALALWGEVWTGRAVKCRCDNAAVVAIVNSGTSRCERAMHLLRSAFFFQGKCRRSEGGIERMWCLGGSFRPWAMGSGRIPHLAHYNPFAPLSTHLQVVGGRAEPIPTPPPSYTAKGRLWHSKSYHP